MLSPTLRVTNCNAQLKVNHRRLPVSLEQRWGILILFPCIIFLIPPPLGRYLPHKKKQQQTTHACMFCSEGKQQSEQSVGMHDLYQEKGQKTIKASLTGPVPVF